MSIPVFPNIEAPVYPIQEDWEDVALVSQFEDGLEISRARFTRSRGKWVLSWNALSNDDYEDLMQFWREDTKGRSQSFTWTHPINTENTYTVRFVEKPPFKNIAPGLWEGEVTLREV